MPLLMIGSITFFVSDVIALRDHIKDLMKLVEKLVTEF